MDGFGEQIWTGIVRVVIERTIEHACVPFITFGLLEFGV
jgi:hypothetical protein